jgi:hypothetical protein
MKIFVLICLFSALINPFCECIQKSRRIVEKASQYLENVRNEKDSKSVIHYHHDLDWSLNEGLLPEEVRVIVNRCQDSTLKELYLKALETLEDKNDGDFNCLLSNSKINPISTTTAKKDYVLCAEKRNGKYDIVSSYITHTEKPDWTKTSFVGGFAYLGSKWIGNRLFATIESILGSWGIVFKLALGVVIGGVFFTWKARKVYERMREADNARILEEFEKKLAKDPLCMSSSGRIIEIFKSCCTEHSTMFGPESREDSKNGIEVKNDRIHAE